MQCIKTGCQMYSSQYGEYFYGDLYALDDTGSIVLLRCVQRSRERLTQLVHAKVDDILQLWDCGPNMTTTNPGTILARECSFNYEGLPNV